MLSAKRHALSTPEIAVVALLFLATALKFAWAANSEGSSDAHLFYLFGKVLQVFPLRVLYTEQPLFNHTPLTGAVVRILYRLSHGNFQVFSTRVRYFGILADVALVFGVLHVRRLTGTPPWWALALFAISPVSLVVSGFHASPDPVMVAFLFFAAVAILHDRPMLCGALFAIACNVKAVAVLLSPLFLFFWFARGVRPLLRFAGWSGIGLLIGSALPLLECPGPYLHHVFGYGGYWGWWGLTFWLKQTGLADFQRPDFQNLSGPQAAIMTVLKVVIVTGIATLGWRRRNLPPREFFGTVGAAWVLVFVFATGAGVHYMVWFAPFILLLAPEWWVALTAASAIFTFVFYQTGSASHSFPWVSSVVGLKDFPIVAPWSNLPWLIFIAFLIRHGRRWFEPAVEETGLGREIPHASAAE